jgi:hypothetical protein
MSDHSMPSGFAGQGSTVQSRNIAQNEERICREFFFKKAGKSLEEITDYVFFFSASKICWC